MSFFAFKLPDVLAKFCIFLARFVVERHLMVSEPRFKILWQLDVRRFRFCWQTSPETGKRFFFFACLWTETKSKVIVYQAKVASASKTETCRNLRKFKVTLNPFRRIF